MKNSGGLSWIIFVFTIFALVCSACEQEPDPYNVVYVTREIWNGIEFRQYSSVTNNQYEITVNKFKTVFYSGLFTDEERAKLRDYVSFVCIFSIDSGFGWFGDSNNKFWLAVPCDVIQSNIESLLLSVLEGIDRNF